MFVVAKEPFQMGEVLGELGFEYIPDPLGRLFQGDWTRPEGPDLDARRFSEHVGRVILVADKNDQKKLRGTRNPIVREAIRVGQAEHRKLKEKVLRKDKWAADKLILNDGRVKGGIRPDVTTPRGRTIELKPDTPSGRAAAKKQTERYRKLTNRFSRAIFYRPPSGVGVVGGSGGALPKVK